MSVTAGDSGTAIASAGALPHPEAVPQHSPIPAPPLYNDVWARALAVRRIRSTILLLALNFSLYCGLCVFTHWLHSARLFDFTWESYFAPLNFWTQGSPNLNDFVLFPIDVTRTPVHAIVLGLLLASVFAVPISVAILYRLPSAVPFVAAVAVFGHMPWLAGTLMASCLLAAARPFRLNFRYGSALMGMLPVLAYLYLATRGGIEQLDQASPTQRALMSAPWVLSILAACAMIAMVLLISRATNFRPHAVAPVLAVMFATPVVLFHVRIGADELLFRVLEAEYGPASQRFAPVVDAKPALREMLRRLSWDDEAFARFGPELIGALTGEATPLRRIIVGQLQTEFLSQRATAHDAFERFRYDFPSSRYTPAILYLHARVLDTRLEDRAMISAEPRRELYADFPHVQSEPYWAALFTMYPSSPLVAAAGLRLAQLHLRRGETNAAAQTLAQLHSMPGVSSVAASRPAQTTLLQPLPVEAGLDYDPAPYLLEARRLEELIRENRDDPIHGNQPLTELAGLDPRRARYREGLARLAATYHDSSLWDNLAVLWVCAAPEASERAALLDEALLALPLQDARAQALFSLAELEIPTPATETTDYRRVGMDRLREVVRTFPRTSWADEAARRLRAMEPISGGQPK